MTLQVGNLYRVAVVAEVIDVVAVAAAAVETFW